MKQAFELYDFIILNGLEVHYIRTEIGNDDEIIVFVNSNSYHEFAGILTEHFSGALDELEPHITSDGSIGINILPLIDHVCMIEDAEIWEARYKQIGGC